jgi:hypothetical protein
MLLMEQKINLSEKLLENDITFSKNKLKREIAKKMLIKMSNDIDNISHKEDRCNNISNVLSTLCKVLFFSTTILSFISAYANNPVYSIVSGTVGVIGNLCFQYSTSSQNEAKSANIKLNQLLANIGVEPVPDNTIPSDIETGKIAPDKIPNLEEMILKTVKGLNNVEMTQLN